MDWLAQNWIWVVLFILFTGMHLFGHGGAAPGWSKQSMTAARSLG